MIYQVFAVFDSKARAFCSPFTIATTELAQRAFREAANAPEQQCCKHPEDFTLFHLGDFNDENAAYGLFKQPQNLGTALNYKKEIPHAE